MELGPGSGGGNSSLVNDEPDDQTTVVGVRPKITRRNVVFIVAITVVYVGWGISRGHYELPIMFLIYSAGAGLYAARPSTIVSAGGIRRPWRPRGIVGWGEVASVVAPTAGLPGVRLQLTSGKVLVLNDIPSDRSEAVAAIGSKPIQRLPIPRTTPPPLSQQDPTPMQMEADVERRAQALAEEWRRMEANKPPNRRTGD